MSWQDTIIAAHTAVTDVVSHVQRLKSERYFVWQEDGANDFIADEKHAERAMTGTTDLFTKQEFDPWVAALEESFDATPAIVWALSSVQFEEDTGFYHYEWSWQVFDDG